MCIRSKSYGGEGRTPNLRVQSAACCRLHHPVIKVVGARIERASIALQAFANPSQLCDQEGMAGLEPATSS